jgi:tetratricopeptide (TPR) repeat protein
MIAALLLLLLLQITPEAGQHINAGMQAKTAGDLDTAIREFKRVVELAPELAAAHVNLGAAYLGKRDYGSAIPALRKALELNPNLPGAQSILGTALLAQGYACESVPHLQKGGPDDLLGVALLECGQPREALDRLEAALGKRPNDPDLLYYLSRTHSELAKRSVERLRAEHPDSGRTQQVMGEISAAAGDRASAEKYFRAALAIRADLRGVHFALGELLLAAGEYQKAEAEFRAEAALSPGSAVTAWRLGSVLANLGRTNEAITELKRADTLHPDMPETLLELGTVLNASGDAQAAEGYLARVLKFERDTALAASAHLQLAQVYRKLGRAGDAEREMKAFQSLRSRTGGNARPGGSAKP